MRRRVIIALATLGIVAWAPMAGADDGLPSGDLVALTYNVAGLPELLSGSDPETNSPLISPLLNDYDLVLLQENWADPHELVEPLPVFFYHHLIVADARHPYQSEPAPHPFGTDLSRLPTGPPLISDGLNRLSNFPFGPIQREMWRSCHGELLTTVLEEIINAAGLEEVLEQVGLGGAIDGGATDCAAQKGFSVARTEFSDGVEVDVYNLHADAGSHPSDVEARADNFAQLAEFLVEHSAGRAVILGGDTNLNTSRENNAGVWSEFLATTGLIDVCGAVDCGVDDHVIDKFAFRSGGGVELEPLTHNFERGTFQRGDGEPLSDHDALAVSFRWTLTGTDQDPEVLTAVGDGPGADGPGASSEDETRGIASVLGSAVLPSTGNDLVALLRVGGLLLLTGAILAASSQSLRRRKRSAPLS